MLRRRLSALCVLACCTFQRSAVRDVVVVGGFIAVATANPSIEVIDLSCMKPHGTLEGHIMAVSALASLEGGARLVSGSHDTFIRQAHLHAIAN